MSFEIDDLMRIDENGKGYVNILRLTDIQDKPKLFYFYVEFIAEIYNKCPKKEMLISRNCYFIDEAHLIFEGKTLLEQIETIVKLIRSKGIGIYFITQNQWMFLVVSLLN
jgi:hypothetical protein